MDSLGTPGHSSCPACLILHPFCKHTLPATDKCVASWLSFCPTHYTPHYTTSLLCVFFRLFNLDMTRCPAWQSPSRQETHSIRFKPHTAS